MRRYVRFMGTGELLKYQRGLTLVNETNWSVESKSTAVGFCFFDDSVDPEKRMEYLNGIVDMSVVAVFETVKPLRFRLSKGIYRNPLIDQPQTLDEALDFDHVVGMTVKEYSLTSYSRDTLRIVKLGKPNPWYMSENMTNSIDWRAYEQIQGE